MFATAGLTAFAVTQFTAASTPDEVPSPLQPSTRTATMSAPGATPYLLPATVPATCVPWPWQSSVPCPSLMAV